MEAEDGSASVASKNKMITTAWDGDWEAFKQRFEATADLNGLNEAIKAGQLLAEEKIKWPWVAIKPEVSSQDLTDIDMNLMSEATAQSRRLASILILSLLDSEGVQKSIVQDRLKYEKDGVRAWADLVTHFEMSTKDLRVESLTKKWDEAILEIGDHPDQL